MPLSGDFTHFTLTDTTVTGHASSVGLLRPYLNVAIHEAPNDQWATIVKEAHSCITDEVAGADPHDSVTVTYPREAVAVMLQAVGYVDRLITIMNEEIDNALAERGDDDEDIDTSGQEDLS